MSLDQNGTVNLADVNSEVVNGLIGEIVSAEPPPEVKYGALLAAMANAQIDQKFLKEMLPKNAFKRSIKELDEGRVIRKTEESADFIKFQFTKETAQGMGFNYSVEDFVTVDKKTGSCTSDIDPQLAVFAEKLINEKMEVRTTGDISRIFKKTFESGLGIYSIRKAGGCYFVPIQSQAMILKFEKFIEEIGGKMRRVQVPGGAINLKTMAEAVVDGTKQVVDQYREAIENYSDTTPPGVIKNRYEAIQELRQRKLAMTEFFGGLIGELDAEFKDLDSLLSKKEEEAVRGKQETTDQIGTGLTTTVVTTAS